MNVKKLTLLLTLLMCIPAIASASYVSLPWTNTYDCADWTDGSPAYDCYGMQRYAAGGPPYETVISDCNMAAGGGGKGQCHTVFDGENVETGSMWVHFTTPPDELWYRFYMRYPEGFKWAAVDGYLPHYDKLVYLGDVDQKIMRFRILNNDIGLVTPTGETSGGSGFGWDYINSAGVLEDGHRLGDGLWHSYEIHITTGVGGTVQIWVDGILAVDTTETILDVEWVTAGANQDEPNNGGGVVVSFDDLAIYAENPPNVDAAGNPMIGPLGWDSADTTASVGSQTQGGSGSQSQNGSGSQSQ